MINNNLRLNEYAVLAYRIFLVFVFYQISRIFFYLFNTSLLQVPNTWDIVKLGWYGIAFDSTAILYINSLFVLLSALPLTINTKPKYQKGLMYLYFVANFIAYSTNFIDCIYYRFSQTRSTRATLDLLKNEENLSALFWHFFTSYWYVLLVFILTSFLWIRLYQVIKLRHYENISKPLIYFPFSIVGILIIAFLMVGGIRGGYLHSTRPINMVDAYRHVKIPNHGDIILNTPFAIFRTLKIKEYKVEDWVSKEYINENIKPIKYYPRELNTERPNIVIFILESFGKEYWGFLNRNNNNPQDRSYTPFLDSLSTSSLVFSNSYANGRQSIHGMSSILAGIPSFQHAFTSSPYAKQNIQSIVSICNDLGYETSFFHGAANGSMGFLGFCNILGFKSYYGRTEYNNDADYDGIWGIWDEPFFQYMGRTFSNHKKPFMTTMFSLSSHDPFKVPQKYENQFKEGNIPIHKCVEYTDYSLKKFFEYAKKQSWYKNTVFVFTGDHTNQNYDPDYNNTIDRFAVPIMFYSANSEYGLLGEFKDLAAQIDIYPTLIDLIGYNKPFRSWGRSLIRNNTKEKPRVINSPGNVYQFMQDNYIYIFDGKNFTGIFDKEDKSLTKNFINQTNKEMLLGMEDCKAFIQNYMYQITHKTLNLKGGKG